MTLGEKLRHLRTDLHMSQVEFAKMCGIAEGTCCKAEQNKHTLRLDTMFLIADKLNMTLSELLEDVDSLW